MAIALVPWTLWAAAQEPAAVDSLTAAQEPAAVETPTAVQVRAPEYTLSAAQELAPADTLSAAETDIAFTHEEITVTARRVDEEIQDVPVSVTAISSEDFERRQLTSTLDLGKATPNLEFANNAPVSGNNASSMVFIRGIGQLNPVSSVDPGVGLYVDDVYRGQSVGGAMAMRDVADVQVLRGPQGTLFGRNTIGGAVLLTTVNPGAKWGGEARVGVGSDGMWSLFGALDAPLARTLKTRIAAGFKRQNGYVTRLSDGLDLGDVNDLSIFAKADYSITSTVRARLRLDYARADENGSPMVFAAYGNNTDPANPVPAAHFGANRSQQAGCPDAFYLPAGPGPRFNPVTGEAIGGGPPVGYTAENEDPRCVNNQWRAGPFRNHGTTPLESSYDNRGIALNVTGVMGARSILKSVTAWRRLNWKGRRDADNTPFQVLHTQIESDGAQFSQEVQYLFSGERFSGVAGMFYYRERVEDDLDVVLGNSDSPVANYNEVSNRAWAVFGQGKLRLTGRTEASIGVRRTSETKGSTPDQFDYAAPDVKFVPKRLYEQTFSATTLSAAVNHHWSVGLMTYARYAQGFKGGGWNAFFAGAVSQESLDNFHSFDEERALSWEVGFKTNLPDRGLRLQGAVFTTDYRDMQFVYRLGPAPLLLNAGEATISGAEIEGAWTPTPSWRIQGGIGYLKDRIRSISQDFALLGATTAVTTEHELPYTPAVQATLGLGYAFGLRGYSVLIHSDVSRRGRTFFDAINTREIARLDDVVNLDASLTLQSKTRRWRAVIGVRNATNEVYPITGNSSLTTGSGYAEVAYARPREYSLLLVRRFGL